MNLNAEQASQHTSMHFQFSVHKYPACIRAYFKGWCSALGALEASVCIAVCSGDSLERSKNSWKVCRAAASEKKKPWLCIYIPCHWVTWSTNFTQRTKLNTEASNNGAERHLSHINDPVSCFGIGVFHQRTSLSLHWYLKTRMSHQTKEEEEAAS